MPLNSSLLANFAVVTLGNCPNTDILCSNIEGTKFVHIQVKTFVPGNSTCTVGLKAKKDYQESFFWILAGRRHGFCSFAGSHHSVDQRLARPGSFGRCIRNLGTRRRKP